MEESYKSFARVYDMFMDDLIKVTKGDKVIFGYFSGTDRKTAACGMQ